MILRLSDFGLGTPHAQLGIGALIGTDGGAVMRHVRDVEQQALLLLGCGSGYGIELLNTIYISL